MASTGTGIVIGSHSLKVVQARKKGGVLRLTRVANVKLDPQWADRPFDARKQEYLSSLLTGTGIKPGEAMMGLTGRDLIIRYTHVPPVPDWRLDMLMKFEIEEVGEQSGGEVCADWTRLDLPESVSGDNTIMVSLAKNAAIEPRIALLKKAGLRVRGGAPNAVGMYHAFVTSAKLPPGEVTLLMHIGAENTDIGLQKDGRLIFARNVSGGGRLFTEAIMNQFHVKADRAEKMKQQKADVTPRSSVRYADSLAEKVSNAVIGVTGQFVSMVHSSVMFCKAQTKLQELSVDRVVLAGGGANLKGLPEYLSSNLGVPVEIFDPTPAADASQLPPEDAEILANDGTGLTVALGLASLALAPTGTSVEILPEEYRRKRRFKERDVFMIGAAAVLLAFIVFRIIWHSDVVDQATTDKNSLVAQRGRLNQQKTAFEQDRENLAIAEQKWRILRDKVRIGPALQKALAITEKVIKENEFPEIHISQVSTDREGRIVMDPNADPNRPGAFGEESEKILIVKVIFKASIQNLSRKPGTVYRGFVDAMRSEVQAHGSITLKEQSPQGNTFQYTLSFLPEPPKAPAAEE